MSSQLLILLSQGLLVVYLVVVVVLIRRQISVVGDEDEEEDEMYKDKGSLPIEKVPNFREFSLLWSKSNENGKNFLCISKRISPF